MVLRVLLIALSFCFGSIAEAREVDAFFSIGLIQPTNKRQKINSFAITHCLSNDVIISTLNLVNDYSALAKCRCVCRRWRSLIDDNIFFKQKYILKYIASFTKKNGSIEKFVKRFLTPLPGAMGGITALDDIIKELQDNLGVSEEQAYKALHDTKFMESCWSLEVGIHVNQALQEKKQLLLPYIPENLFKEDLEGMSQRIELKVTKKGAEINYLLGLRNLPLLLMEQITRLSLDRLGLQELPSLQQFSRVRVLNLSNNNLKKLPDWLFEKLTALQSLYLNNNQLSEISGIERLTGLKDLFLDNNQLSSTSGIEKLMHLDLLTLYQNPQLSDVLGVTKLTNLQQLCLGNTQVSGNKLSIIKTALPNCMIWHWY